MACAGFTPSGALGGRGPLRSGDRAKGDIIERTDTQQRQETPMKLTGVLPAALVTPFDANSKIDFIDPTDLAPNPSQAALLATAWQQLD
jgi:hypothetical protein